MAARDRARASHGAALVVANPLPRTSSSTRTLHDRVLADGPGRGRSAQGVRGKDVTPFLLGAVPRHRPAGASLRANVRLVLRNAALAARIAVALAALR